MIVLMKLNLPKDIIINIINYNLYLHQQNIKKIINYNRAIKVIPRIVENNIFKPYIIITNKKYINKKYINKRLIKFIYKVRNMNIIYYLFINENMKPKDISNLYKI